jgi:hypothetical protein
MKDCRFDAESLGNLADAVEEHCVARDPKRHRLFIRWAKREPDHVTDERVTQRRTVAARRRDDLHRGPSGRLEKRGLPRIEPTRTGSESPSA